MFLCDELVIDLFRLDGILARKGRTFVLTESEEVPDVTTMNVQPENTHSMEHESLPVRNDESQD
jgi:hypothetical protein